MILRVDDYVCLSRYRRVGQSMPFQSGRDHEDGDVLAVCVDFIIPGFGTTYIAVFEHNEGAKNLAQNPVCTSNSKYIYVRTPVLRERIFGGRYSVIRV